MPADKINNDKELMLSVAEGSEVAFRKIFDKYREPFYAAAFKMTRSEDLSEEIVQEVFIKLWIKRSQIASADNPAGYLFKILYNSIYAQFKKIASEKQMMKAIGEQAPEPENSIEDILLEKENRKFLDDLIDKLPPQRQLVYKLSKQEGLSREEIAERLHISPNTVKNHLLSAIKFIRANLDGTISVIIWTAIMDNL